MPRLLDLTCPLDPDYPGNKGLVAAWVAVPELAAGLTLFDLLNTGRANPNHGTLVNGPVWAAESSGFPAVQFDGSNDYITCGAAGNFTSEDFALEFCVRRDGDPSNGTVFAYKGQFQANGWYIQSEQATGKYLKFVTNQPGANQETYTGAEYLTTGVWRHVVVTRSGTAAKIYVDGIDRTSVSGSHSNPTSSSDNLQFGQYATTATIFSWVGAGRGWRLYQRAPSPAEIRDLYDQSRREWGQSEQYRWLDGVTYSLPSSPPPPLTVFLPAFAA